MCAILRDFLDKYRSLIAYLFFGALTTIVNWCAYFPLRYTLSLSAALSSGIAWLIAVIFAFPVNKIFVYRSTQRKPAKITLEFVRFVGCRLFSGLLEAGVLFVVDDLLHWNGVIWKILASVIVVCMNYITGKLLVFHEK